MASAFQRQKVAGVFGAMGADGDGYLDEADFEALTARWTKVRDQEPGSDGYERIRALMMGWWEALQEASDQDRDDKVTLDEVMALVDRLGEMTDAIVATAHSMFDAVDQDGDGTIGPAEYAQVVTGWKGYEAESEGIFPLLDLDGERVHLPGRVRPVVDGLLDGRRSLFALEVGVRPLRRTRRRQLTVVVLTYHRHRPHGEGRHPDPFAPIRPGLGQLPADVQTGLDDATCLTA